MIPFEDPGTDGRQRPLDGSPSPFASGPASIRSGTMSESVVPIRRALLSVYDKRGLVELARSLAAAGSSSWPAAARGPRWSRPGSR